LTPGSHVEYFFRKSNAPAGTAAIEVAPDTVLVNGAGEASSDLHRWQQFGVLPDRWKDGAFADGNATAPACMLYVDWCDRRGPEGTWVFVADTIGATTGSYVAGRPSGRFGAHNGWHAVNTGANLNSYEVGNDPTLAVYTNGGQPGTIWDMYGIK